MIYQELGLPSIDMFSATDKALAAEQGGGGEAAIAAQPIDNDAA
jgi:hypothetical protein